MDIQLSNQILFDYLHQVIQKLSTIDSLERQFDPEDPSEDYLYHDNNKNELHIQYEQFEDNTFFVRMILGSINCFGSYVYITLTYSNDNIIRMETLDDNFEGNSPQWEEPKGTQYYKEFFKKIINNFLKNDDKSTLKIN